jgi:hypothetical protein
MATVELFNNAVIQLLAFRFSLHRQLYVHRQLDVLRQLSSSSSKAQQSLRKLT